MLSVQWFQVAVDSTWVDAAIRLGVPTAILVAMGYFILRHVWPFIVKQIEDNKNERITERDRFLVALERRDTEFEKVVRAVEQLALAVRADQDNRAEEEKWREKQDSAMARVMRDIEEVRVLLNRRS